MVDVKAVLEPVTKFFTFFKRAPMKMTGFGVGCFLIGKVVGQMVADIPFIPVI